MNYKDYVVQNPKYMRPEELKYLRGDSSKAREVLGWKPEYTFESMIDEMIDEMKKQNKLMMEMIKTQKETGKTEIRLDGRKISETVGDNFYDIGSGQ